MHVKLGDRTANEGSRVSKRLHRWRAFHVKRGDVTRLTDAALLLLLDKRCLPFMDAELLDEVSFTREKRIEHAKPRSSSMTKSGNAHDHIPCPRQAL
jgi:hypothetical protein